MIFYPLDKKVISDIRILLTQGSASISEIKIDGVKM